jgi:hypothetical protein
VLCISVADSDDFLPDPDPGLVCSGNFFGLICSKLIIMNQKAKEQRFLKYLWLSHKPKS